MAAHLITAIENTIQGVHELTQEENDKRLMLWEHGLSYAQFGDILDYNDWIICNGFKNVLALAYFWWYIIREKYTQEWESLGRPKTAEEWFSRKYK